jgi:hypothetical protein
LEQECDKHPFTFLIKAQSFADTEVFSATAAQGA